MSQVVHAARQWRAAVTRTAVNGSAVIPSSRSVPFALLAVAPESMTNDRSGRPDVGDKAVNLAS
jgi:hypothetical protein